MVQYGLFLLNCFSSLSKTIPIFGLLWWFWALPNGAYGQTLSEEQMAFAKVSGQVGTAQKTAQCLLVLSPQDKSVKEVFCQYELGKPSAIFMDDAKGRITIIGKNRANLSDAVLQSSRSHDDFLANITAFFNKTGYELPVDMDIIATFMSSRDFPNGHLAGNKPTNVYILSLDYLAEKTDGKTFAFLVHNLMHKSDTLTYTESDIENLKQNNEAFNNLTKAEVRKLFALELDSLASKAAALKILQKEDVKAILLDQHAKELLKDDNVINVLDKENVPTILANYAVQSILSDENALARLSDNNLIAFLNKEGVPELLNNPTVQAFLQHQQNDLEDNLLILQFAVFVGSQLEIVILVFAFLVILLFQWRLSKKTRNALTSLEQGKHGNTKIIQDISYVKNQLNVDSEIRQKLYRLEDILEENYGIKTVKQFLQVLSGHGLPELDGMDLSKLPEWASNQFESQQKKLALLPPANSRLTRTVLHGKLEMVSQIKEQHTANGEEPVEKILMGLDALVRQEFQSEAEMWEYLLQKTNDKWLENLLATLEQYFLMQEKLAQLEAEQNLLQIKLSERFILPANEMGFSQWANHLLKQEGTWVLIPPQFIDKLLSRRQTVVSQIDDVSKGRKDKHLLQLLRTEAEISQGWHEFVNKPFQSQDDIWKHLQEVSDKWVIDLQTVLNHYLLMKVEIEKLPTLLATRFRLSKPQDKHFSEWTDELLTNQEGTWLWLKPHFINELLSSKQEAIQEIRTKMGSGNKKEPVLQLLCADELSKGWNAFLGMSFQSQEDTWAHLHKISENWLGTLLTVLEPYPSMKAGLDTAQTALSERFTPKKTEPIDFSLETFRTQTGIWHRLQLHFIAELSACEKRVDELKKTGAKFPACEKIWTKKEVSLKAILELLYVDDIRKGWKALVNQQFSSDNDMLLRLFQAGEGRWIHKLFRASDLLQAYFTEQPQFLMLSRHLADVAYLLETMFVETGITVLRPKLLKPISEGTIPERLISSEGSKVNNTLRALKFVQEQVADRLDPDSPNHCSQFVVDVETYGFVYDPETDNPTIRVILTNPSDWSC